MKARDDRQNSATKVTQIPWYVPKLTSNQGDPTFKILGVGSSNGSLWGSPNYQIFRGSGGYKCSYADEYWMYQDWYFWSLAPLQLKDFGLETFVYSSSSRGAPAKRLTWWGSNDNSNWTQIFYNDGWEGAGWRYYEINSGTSYNYFRFRIWNAGHSYADEIAFRNFYFNATQPAIIDGGKTLRVPYMNNNYKGMYDA